MAIAQMAKVMIVSHRTEASELLEVLQREGICHILNAQEAMVSRNFPELGTSGRRPRDIEELLNRLAQSISFLKSYAEPAKGLADVLSPRTVVNEQSYNRIVSDRQILGIIDRCEQTEATIEKLNTRIEGLCGTLEMLEPWEALQTPVEEIGQLRTATCWTGFIPDRLFQQVQQEIGELSGAIEAIGTAKSRYACLIACLNEQTDEVQKLLRSAEFEPVSFEGPHEQVTGTIAESIRRHREKLNETKNQLQDRLDKAALLSENLLNLQILFDHYKNLLNREQTKDTAPATEHTVLLEGWVKKADFPRLEKIVSGFGASSLATIEPAEDEKVPVEIENKNYIRPFEVITRLYGMPQHFEVDPTVFLAPFFALFFALCLTDAGYGLVIIVLMALFIKKIQGDKKLMWMLGICSAVTVVAGALTGGWFGPAEEHFIPALEPVREKMLLFDPLDEPMKFFILVLVLGYIQILTGLVIALGHNLKRRDYVAALCNQLTWLVMLNSIVGLLLAKAGMLPAWLGAVFAWTILLPAAVIFLFSQRQGSWVSRLGVGAYNLFSGIFYMGDVLSYLRLMALGMVTAGLAMAINTIAGIVLGWPYGIGIVAMIVVLAIGHTFNLAISGLSAFVHTLRLQYVEFFPKFFVGGGRLFEPLNKKYKHIYIKQQE